MSETGVETLRKFYRVREVREMFGNVSKTWVYDRMKDGRLEAKRLCGVVLITKESVERLAAEAKPWI